MSKEKPTLLNAYIVNATCLNESEANKLDNLLKGNGILESDCDEQLLISLPFSGQMRLHAILLEGSAGRIKLFANRSALSFDFSNAESEKPLTELTLTAQQTEKGKGRPLDLDTRKFNKVHSLEIFVQGNLDEEETTKISKLEIWGFVEVAGPAVKNEEPDPRLALILAKDKIDEESDDELLNIVKAVLNDELATDLIVGLINLLDLVNQTMQMSTRTQTIQRQVKIYKFLLNEPEGGMRDFLLGWAALNHVSNDPAEAQDARDYLNRSAEKFNSPWGKFGLGMWIMYNNATHLNPVNLFQQAAKANCPGGDFGLGIWFYEKGEGELASLEKAEQAGLLCAQMLLARVYQEGARVPIDPHKAADLYLKRYSTAPLWAAWKKYQENPVTNKNKNEVPSNQN